MRFLYFFISVSCRVSFKLVRTKKAIEICKPGTLYREIGNVIGNYIESKGLSVVITYCGHGVGKLFHTAPNVPHYKNNKAVGAMKVKLMSKTSPVIFLRLNL